MPRRGAPLPGTAPWDDVPPRVESWHDAPRVTRRRDVPTYRMPARESALARPVSSFLRPVAPRPAAQPPRGRRRRHVSPNASVLLSKGQLLGCCSSSGGSPLGSYFRPRLTVTVMVAACMAFYIVTAWFKLVITMAGRGYRPPR